MASLGSSLWSAKLATISNIFPSMTERAILEPAITHDANTAPVRNKKSDFDVNANKCLKDGDGAIEAGMISM